MLKSLIFIIISVFFVHGCGQRSEIKNAVEAQRLAEVYGDGKHTILPLVLPLSDQEIASFDSPLGKVGFIAGGFSKLFMNIGASLGMGKLRLTLIQQVPELPQEYLHSAKIKRIFFYIQPVKDTKREMTWYQRIFLGRDNVDFNFINRLGVRLSSYHLENVNAWLPTVETAMIGKREYSPLEQMFRVQGPPDPILDGEDPREVVLVKYDNKKKDAYLQNDEQGQIYILNTHEPIKTKKFLMNHPKLLGYFKRMHVLNKSVLVELVRDPVVEESFQMVLGESKVEVEKLGVTIIEPCSKSTCMDFRVPDLNLVPLLLRDNALKLDAFIEAGKVPDSFQLKGFIEFEIKLKLTF